MEIAGYIAALLIGISLGMIGGGGSILTVPVLVYLLGINPLLATTYSLFIVGITSLTGGIRAYTRQQVDFKTVTEFGVPSIFSVFLARHYLLPVIPVHLFYIGNIEITRDRLLMLVFAVLMFMTALVILTGRNKDEKNTAKDKVIHNTAPQLIISGLLVGLVTGLLGAGGGFLIIPILLFFIKLPMKTAVGTSLLIVAINCLFGFLFSLKQFSLDWKILSLFTAIAVSGIFIGSRFADKVPAIVLKKIFGWFILIMGIYIVLKEILLPHY